MTITTMSKKLESLCPSDEASCCASSGERHGYLPTDDLGLLYCWPCWDRLEKENPRLAGHTEDEKCDQCEETIKQDKTPIWKLSRKR